MMNSNYRPFTCYFCNKLIQRETESIHITTCGSVLEPCPNKCGSYVPRNMKVKHMQECANKRNNTFPRLMKQKRIEQVDLPSSPASSTSGNGIYNGVSLPPNLSPYRDRERENERDRERDRERDHINIVTNKFLALEQAFAQLQKTTDIIKSRQEQLQARAAAYENLKLQNEKTQYQTQVLQEWKKNVDMQLNSLNYESGQNIKSRTESETKWLAMIDEKMRLVQDLNANLNTQKDNFLKEQIYNRETQNELQAEVKKFQVFYTQENATVCALWSDQGKQIESIKENIASLKSNLEDQKLKHGTVVFDLRAISQVSSENAEKLEMQERELKELKRSFFQLKVDVEMLEEATISREHALPGHIVWKISDFALKLETAKSNNFVLKGPIFYSHSYGYKIRLIVYLNGIKKWKGRHMIACLHVLRGEYDLMLTWPCNIEGNVIIRDLQDYATPRNITKLITAKRHYGDEDTEEPQESSSNYIFVPHAQLLKSNYVKDDTIFIEVKVNSRKRQEETSL